MVDAGAHERLADLSAPLSNVALVRNSLSRLARAADRTLSILTCGVAAVLLVAEVVLLGSGIVARYALHRPLLWSDELAVTLFLWLSMLGTAIALRQGQHLRLTTLLATTTSRTRANLETAATLLAAAFALALIIFGYEYALGEVLIVSPGLGISAAWRAAALPVGGALMLEACLSTLMLSAASARTLLVVIAGLVALLAAGWSVGDALSELGNWNLIIFFVVLVTALLLLGVPIAFAFGLVTFSYLGLTTSTPLEVVLARLDGGMSHIVLMAIPLFVLLGKLMEVTGMAGALVGFLAMLVGHVRGGLSYALLVAMYIVSGISGAKTADMAAVAPILFPEMRKRGSDEGEMVSLLAASAVMSETIPPSLVLIAIATSVGVSIAALFTAGLLPALIAAIALCTLVYWRSRGEARLAERPDFATLVRAFALALPGVVLPFVIRAAVVEGVATATEVSVIGVAYVILVGLAVNHTLPWSKLVPILIETAVLSGSLLLILGAANAMAWALTQSGFSETLAQMLTGMPGGRYGFLAVAIAVFIVFGSVLEGLPAIALFGPLLFPIARTFGIHDIHFAMVAILAMGVGLYMPPFGVGYYSACAIGGVDPSAGMRRIWPYIGLLLCATIVVATVPALSTCFLP